MSKLKRVSKQVLSPFPSAPSEKAILMARETRTDGKNEKRCNADLVLAQTERSIISGIGEALARLRVRMDRADAYYRQRDAERANENLLDRTLEHVVERARDRARTRWRMH
jgi:hypothetical protein